METENLLSVTIPEFTIEPLPPPSKEQDIFYHINVRFSTQTWVIKKTYDQFKVLHEKCSKKFGNANVPYFTGPIPIFAVSEKNGEKRRGKLEGYLNEMFAKWPSWRPTKGLVMEVPHPDGYPGVFVKIHVFLFEFFDVDQHLVRLDRGETVDEIMRREAEARAAKAMEKKDAEILSVQQRLEKNELTETEAEREMIRARAVAAEAAAKAVAGVVNPEATPEKGKGKKAAVKAKAIEDAYANARNFVEDDDGFAIVEHEVADIKKNLSQFTSTITLQCKDWKKTDKFVEYGISVTVCGQSWSLLKRYSDFEKFHALVCKTYAVAETTLPSFQEAFAPRWAKFDDDICAKRKVFFTKYLTALKDRVDSWAPFGLTHRLTLHGTETNNRNALLGFDEKEGMTDNKEHTVHVELNKLLYDFLNVEAYADKLDAMQAVETQKVMETKLDAGKREDLGRARKEEMKSVRELNFASRAKALPGALKEEEIRQFASMLTKFADDREAIRKARQFVATGYHMDNTSRPSNLMQLTLATERAKAKAMSTSASSPLGATQGSNASANAFGSMDALAQEESSSSYLSSGGSVMRSASTLATFANAPTPCSISSRGLATIVAGLEFDDTRAEVVRILSRCLSDDADLNLVMDTMMYDWDSLHQEIIEKLSKKDETVH